MDREIPWRVIMQGSRERLNQYVEANKKEFASWQSWGTTRPLTEDKCRKVVTDPVTKKRIIPARNAYRDKLRGAGPGIKPKCRTAVLGCLDPDLHKLNRSAPTPTKLSEMLVIQTAVSGMNQATQLDKRTWHLWSGDVSAAFLQGVPEERHQPLYMKAPRDGTQRLAGTFPAELYEVLGNLYGFASAPRTWAKHVVATLLRADFTQHRLDRMCFYTKDLDGRLMGGLPEINLIKEGDTYSVNITQRSFIRELTMGQIPKGKLMTEQLDKDGWREFKSVAGSLQWLAGQSRPDAAAVTNKGRETTYNDLFTLYEAIAAVKATENLGILIGPIPLNKATLIVGYGDSSWANANAMDECVDRGTYLNYFLTELLYNCQAKYAGRRLRQLQVTDCVCMTQW
ncbi:unnamed protein product [Effrenium voratum]|nr:unnamed protein product [Effrenium voratum]